MARYHSIESINYQKYKFSKMTPHFINSGKTMKIEVCEIQKQLEKKLNVTGSLTESCCKTPKMGSPGAVHRSKNSLQNYLRIWKYNFT